MRVSLLVVAPLLLATVALPRDLYIESVRQWRADRETRLRAGTGWLTVAGLFWLKKGTETIGSAASSDIRLPAHSAPARLGQIEFHDGQATLHYADRSKGSVQLASDNSGNPTKIALGALTFWVIQRGNRYGLRLLDRESEIRKSFTGCKWYPVDPEYRIVARFVSDPKRIRIPSIIGVTNEEESPGYVEFERDGETIRAAAHRQRGVTKLHLPGWHERQIHLRRGSVSGYRGPNGREGRAGLQPGL